ncbi:MAG: hypothetical protein KHZ92_02040 [Ruminococcus bicirculans]|nr:hypothetical protein [Ruminococcus bicirculans (ex Wegman et al. 2014)]
MSNISIPQQIDEIIAKRKQRLDSLEATKRTIDDAAKSVSDFRAFQNRIKNSPESFPMFKGDYSIIERITEISTEEFSQLYADYSRELDRLTARLSRDSLNISFIGREGQGKSLVMKNISGLDNSVIPSSDGTSCTGAKSIITNVDSDSVTAEITFYTGDEIVGIINSYLHRLTNGKQHITKHWQIPEIDVNTIQAEAEESEEATDDVAEMCDNLREYVEHYDKYKDDLDKVMSVEKDQIEMYVSHYSCNDPTKKYYKHLGVKLANIKARFPHSDVGRIVLVDTIGLGKTAIGVEDEMLKAVENDSDAIILITRPDAKRYSLGPDWKLLKRIQERVSKAYTKEMLFWVMNRVEKGESNVTGVNELINQIGKKDYAVAKALNVNCLSGDEVVNRLLIPVLKHLSARITEVDKHLIEKLNRLGEQLFEAFKGICTASDCALANSANDDIKRRFFKRINSTIKKGVLGQLRTLYLTEYEPRRDIPCEELMDAVEVKLNNILNCVPSKEQIIEFTEYGDANQVNVYESCTNLMRLSIIDDFTQLNDVLEKLVEEMKMQVLHIFADDEYGRLGTIIPLNKATSSDAWIDSFLEKIDGEKNYKFFAAALRKFQSYTINVQGFLIHEVRDQLDNIDISIPKKNGEPTVPQISAPMSDPDAVADDIYEWLRTYVENIHDNVEIALRDLYKTPNKSLFAAIKDLYDRITYTMVDNESKIAEEWRYLYEDWMALIWKDDYQKESALQSIAEEWNAVTGALSKLNSIEYFTIEN